MGGGGAQVQGKREKGFCGAHKKAAVTNDKVMKVQG